MATVRSRVYSWEPGTHSWEDARRANSSLKGAAPSGVKFVNVAKWHWDAGGGLFESSLLTGIVAMG